MEIDGPREFIVKEGRLLGDGGLNIEA